MASLQQAQARAKIEELIASYNRLDQEARANITESSVVTQFIEPLLRALGWPIEDPTRYTKELHTQAGRPDIILKPEAGGVIFVEAKRFGAIRELKEARQTISGIVMPGQLTLPGMATDRTSQEQQAINYAFENNATWAILTNFERLRLFNARRDWLVLSFERPSAYLDQFDYLWQLSYESVLNGELDRLSDQRYREDVDTDYLSFIHEYRERLARDIIGRPGVNRWAFIGTTERINLPLLRDVVQRFLDRLVVVRFAEDHFVLKPSRLKSLIEANLEESYGVRYGFSLTEVIRRFFRNFDDIHNSALFAHDPILDEQAEFSEELVVALIDKLYEARYRAMTPDIMGNTYEQYLGTTLVQVDGRIETRSNLETRKKQGSYYTPQVIVRYLVDRSLGRYLYGTVNGRPDGEPVEGERRKTPQEIGNLRVLDPACGSGSFLIYAYEVLAEFYRAEIARLTQEKEAYIARRSIEIGNPLEAIGEGNAAYNALIEPLKDYPRIILERHLYGVDLDPQAAELAAVNLIFRAMEDQRRMKSNRKLPLILNQNVKCGNALIGAGPGDPRYADHLETLVALRRLRAELAANSHDGRVQKAIEEAAGRIKAALEQPLAAYFTDVEARRPFHWGVEFPEVFVDAEGNWLGDQGGFDVIVGNPPWEIVKPDLREYYAQFEPDIEHRLKREDVERRIKQLNALDPMIKAEWEAQKTRIEEDGAYYRSAVAGFTRQGRGDTALHKLFMERVWGLLKHQGRLGYIVPSGIYTDLGTKELREMLMGEGSIESLIGLTNGIHGGKAYFEAIHRSFKFSLINAQKGVKLDAMRIIFRIDPRTVPLPEELSVFTSKAENYMVVKPEMIQRFSPDSLSLMEFRSQRDYEITEKIYGSWPLIGQKTGVWDVKFTRELDMTNDRHLFNTQGRGLPLYEGKMIWQFDAFFAEPRFWVEESKGRKALLGKNVDEGQQLDYQRPRLAFRDIARGTDERTLICAMLPSGRFCNNKAPNISIEGDLDLRIPLFLVGILNSFLLDFVIRNKINTTLNFFFMETLPVLRLLPGNPYFDAIVPRAARLTCTRAAFADLWQEVMGEAWDESKGATDPAERQRLRDEIDALVAHLYGLSREDFEHILGAFPLVFPTSAEGHAKREALLAVYDEFAAQVAGWPKQ